MAESPKFYYAGATENPLPDPRHVPRNACGLPLPLGADLNMKPRELQRELTAARAASFIDAILSGDFSLAFPNEDLDPELKRLAKPKSGINPDFIAETMPPVDGLQDFVAEKRLQMVKGHADALANPQTPAIKRGSHCRQIVNLGARVLLA